MVEYISREALEKWLLTEMASLDSDADRQCVVERLRKEITAADVRPVVMCRDCEYWKQWDNTTHYLCTYVAGAKFIRNAEDFCSRGEKREES